jgi:hypothetical protein
MSANQLRGPARTETRRLASFASGCSAIALSALTALAMAGDGSAQDAQEEIAAVYKAREIDFFYRSTSIPRPCHELQNRVANILLAIGARDDIQVRVSGCDYIVEPQDSDLDRWGTFERPGDQFRNRRSDREQSAHVRIRLMTPVAVTPEVLAEIDRDKSRRELVSRVTGNRSVGLNDPIVFAAQRQSVTLSRRVIRLEPEDCELLEQMTGTVFRELDIRVVRRNFTCDRRQASRITPQLTVEALLPTGSLLPMPPPEENQKSTAPSAPETPPPGPPAESPAQ